MEIIAYIQHQAATNQIFSGALLGGALLGILNSCKKLPEIIWNRIMLHTIVSFTIYNQDESYFYFQKWIQELNFARHNKRFTITTGWDKGVDCRPEGEVEIPDIILSPSAGNYIVKHSGKWLLLSCMRGDPVQGKFGPPIIHESLTIRYFGQNVSFVENVIKDLKQAYFSASIGKLSIWNVAWTNEWRKTNTLPKRLLSSIVAPADLITDLCADVREFLNSEDWYSLQGIPWHRGYLLYGPPGTGKTSTIMALASDMNRPIYCITASPLLTDDALVTLFGAVPSQALLVIEDIDCLFKTDRLKPENTATHVTLSGLLNTLDGFCSKHGALLFITTNNREALDPAILRPGRIDKHIELPLCGKEQVFKMFIKFYGMGEEKLATEFQTLVEENTVSPAQLQEHFMENRYSAEDAVSTWGAKCKTKKKGIH